MKNKTAQSGGNLLGGWWYRIRNLGFLMLAGAGICHPGGFFAFAQGSAITYQGRLVDNGAAANGTYDLRFILYDADPGGSQQGPVLTNSATAVTAGLFTVTLQFGANAFTGGDRWLEIATRTNGIGAFVTLSPRQKIGTAPYAITAGNVTGVIPSTSLSGSYPAAVALTNSGNQFSGNGAGLVNVNAVTFLGLGTNGFWTTHGNAGTVAGAQFMGTTDNQPLELRVGNQRAFQLEPNTNGAPNLLAGASNNYLAPDSQGSVISGGGVLNFGGGQGFSNSILSSFSLIGGGAGNSIQSGSDASVIIGGSLNTILTDATDALLGGGFGNLISSNASGAVLGGGGNNFVEYLAQYATLGGGSDNDIGIFARWAVLAGGASNTNAATYGAVGGGYNNLIQTNAQAATVAGGFNNAIQQDAFSAVVGGGDNNNIISGADHATIGGGFLNRIEQNSSGCTIAGGELNVIFGPTPPKCATIGGGSNNLVQLSADFGVVGGGENNTSSGRSASVPGGQLNVSKGDFSLAAGRRAKANHAGTFVWADSPSATGADFGSSSSNQFLIRAGGGVGINATNPVFALTVGSPETPVTSVAQIGAFNSGSAFVVARNTSGNLEMSVGVDGVQGVLSTMTDHPLVLRSGNGTGSGNHEFFRGHTNGNVGIGITTPTNKLHVAGGATFIAGTSAVVWTPGSASWSFTSDRNAKERIESTEPQAILAKLCSIPISEWSYKGYPQRHLGPMAQDFHNAFPFNESDTSLNDADLHGVALAGIQGLNQKLERKIATTDSRLHQLEKKNAELENELMELKAVVAKLIPASTPARN